MHLLTMDWSLDYAPPLPHSESGSAKDLLSAKSARLLGSVKPGLYRELWRHQERFVPTTPFPHFARTTGQERKLRD